MLTLDHKHTRPLRVLLVSPGGRLLLLAVAILQLTSCDLDNKTAPTEAAAKVGNYNADTAAVAALISKANSFLQSNFDSMHFYGKVALDKAAAIGFPAGIAKAKIKP